MTVNDWITTILTQITSNTVKHKLEQPIKYNFVVIILFDKKSAKYILNNKLTT